MLLEDSDKLQAENMTEDMVKNPADYPSTPLVRLRIEYTGGY